MPFSSPDLPNPGIEPGSPALQADSLTPEPPGKPWVTSTTCLTQAPGPSGPLGGARRRQESRQRKGRKGHSSPGVFPAGSPGGLPAQVTASPGDRLPPSLLPGVRGRHKLFVGMQLLSHAHLCDPMDHMALQAPLSLTISQSLLKVMSTESVMLSNHLILCHPLLLMPPTPLAFSLSLQTILSQIHIVKPNPQSNRR